MEEVTLVKDCPNFPEKKGKGHKVSLMFKNSYHIMGVIVV